MIYHRTSFKAKNVLFIRESGWSDEGMNHSINREKKPQVICARNFEQLIDQQFVNKQGETNWFVNENGTHVSYEISFLHEMTSFIPYTIAKHSLIVLFSAVFTLDHLFTVVSRRRQAHHFCAAGSLLQCVSTNCGRSYKSFFWFILLHENSCMRARPREEDR